MFYPYEGYRSVAPRDAARVNKTIFHNHSCKICLSAAVTYSTYTLFLVIKRLEPRLTQNGVSPEPFITSYDKDELAELKHQAPN